MVATVIAALRRFLPDFLKKKPGLNDAPRRAIWAISHCRTSVMGGHLHACEPCDTREFRFHSCNHRSCPQCGREATAQWVERELERRVGAPYFMATFTLPSELRALFFTPLAKEVYRLFFDAAAHALRVALAHRRSLGATTTGFTLVLHTWNQRLLFHPHLHAIVPGVGIDANGQIIPVKQPTFLAPKAVLRRAFRQRFRAGLKALMASGADLPSVAPSVWRQDWGVKISPFGNGQNIIKYLGAYVCRTAITDARLQSTTDTDVSFIWKDRQHGNVQKTETVSGVEFVERYLRHVLPSGLKAIRHYGFCHPAAKLKRERIAFHTGRPLLIGETADQVPRPPRPSGHPTCPCCGQPMKRIGRILPPWRQSRAPPMPTESRQIA
jgi:hypothetical protein